MDFREYRVLKEDGEIVISGTIHEPVHWDFSISMCEDDVAGIARIATRRATVGLLLRALFRRKKRSHWAEPRKEHIAKVKARIKEADDKRAEEAAAEKAKAKAASETASESTDENAGENADENADESTAETPKRRGLFRRPEPPDAPAVGDNGAADAQPVAASPLAAGSSPL